VSPKKDKSDRRMKQEWKRVGAATAEKRQLIQAIASPGSSSSLM